MTEASIIAGQHHVLTLVAVVNVAELMLQLVQVARSSSDILLRISNLISWQTKVIGRAGHNLHQTACSGPRLSLWIEGRLLIALSSQQSPVPAYTSAVALEQLIVIGDDASRQHGSMHTSLDTRTLQQLFLFLAC